MRIGFRARLFLALFGVATVTLALGAVLIAAALGRQTYQRIEASLVAEARLLADLLPERASAMPPVELEKEAKRLGEHLPARVTFIDPSGHVISDSALNFGDLESVAKPQRSAAIIEARQAGVGTARRHSQTTQTDLLYAAARTSHPTASIVRLALPLTEIDQQMRAITRATLAALLMAMAGAAGLAWAGAALLGRRVRAIATVAGRYAAGDLSQPVRDYARDEIGTVSRVLDESVRALAERAAELAEDRARMDAILTGMAEGVLAVDSQGMVQVANRSAQAMLGIGAAAVGRHYLEAVRHPGVADQLASALAGTGAGGARDGAGAQPGAARRRARRAGGCGRRARRRSGPARHHRPAPGGSDAPRLRRERVARAAHAPHGDPRVRRGARRRGAGRSRTAAVPGGHRAAREPHGANRPRPAEARRARGAPGDGRERRSTSTRCSAASTADLAPPSSPRRSTSTSASIPRSRR